MRKERNNETGAYDKGNKCKREVAYKITMKIEKRGKRMKGNG